MRKRLLFIFFLGFYYFVAAQEIQFTAEEKAILDSMFKSDEFVQLFDKKKDSSYVDFGIGLGNGIFSLKNNSLNAAQATTNKIFYTPFAGYFHKSGFGFTATAFLTSDYGRLKSFQYALSPSYNYFSPAVNWGVSYTRYIRGQSTGFEINPFQNDLYGNITFKKPWLRPTIGMGYSRGRTTEYFDSVITFILPPRTVKITDTIKTTLSSFSLNFSISHMWEFESVLFHNDVLQVQPGLMINGSNQKLLVKHSNSLNERRPIVQNLLKRAYGDGVAKERFSVQSFAVMFGAAYGKGKFIVQPNLYLDFYLHDTDSKKLSPMYSFLINYVF